MRSFIVALSIFLASCTSMTTPRGIDDSAVYAMGQVTAVRKACTQASVTGVIAIDDERVCLELTDEARAYIEMARLSTSEDDKQRYLNKALEILSMVQQVLAQMEKQ